MTDANPGLWYPVSGKTHRHPQHSGSKHGAFSPWIQKRILPCGRQRSSKAPCIRVLTHAPGDAVSCRSGPLCLFPAQIPARGSLFHCGFQGPHGYAVVSGGLSTKQKEMWEPFADYSGLKRGRPWRGDGVSGGGLRGSGSQVRPSAALGTQFPLPKGGGDVSQDTSEGHSGFTAKQNLGAVFTTPRKPRRHNYCHYPICIIILTRRH